MDRTRWHLPVYHAHAPEPEDTPPDPPHPPFDLANRPPATPPPTAPHPQLWTIQLHWWNRHTPHPNERHCHFCRQLWPCASWFHWDDLLRRSLGCDTDPS